MNELVTRLLPPVETTDGNGRTKPSRQQPEEQLATAALGAATLLASVAMAGAISALGTPEMARTAKIALLVASVVASIGLIVSARFGNRFVSAILALAAGFLGPGTLLAVWFVIPHYGLAMWMIFRQNKLARVQATERRAERLAAGGSRPASRGRGGKAAPKRPDGRLAPPPSKRYTPPRPKKKVVPKPDDKKVDSAPTP